MIIIELLKIQGTILEAQPAFNLPELTVTSFPGEGSRRGLRGFVSRFLPLLHCVPLCPHVAETRVTVGPYLMGHESLWEAPVPVRGLVLASAFSGEVSPLGTKDCFFFAVLLLRGSGRSQAVGS